MFERIISGNKALEKSLEASSIRNEAIAQNISNIDTPGYQRKKVLFEEFLNNAMEDNMVKGRRTDSRHIPIGGQDVDNVDSKIIEDGTGGAMRLDGNTVDIDVEMAELAKNTAKYNTLVQLLSSSYRDIKSVIAGGR